MTLQLHNKKLFSTLTFLTRKVDFNIIYHFGDFVYYFLREIENLNFRVLRLRLKNFPSAVTVSTQLLFFSNDSSKHKTIKHSQFLKFYNNLEKNGSQKC